MGDFHPGEMMKLYRIRKKMSQEKLAMVINQKSPHLLTYQMQISRIEQGKDHPEEPLRAAIECALGYQIWPNDVHKRTIETSQD
ncbi:helix-turn-helix domain-containing protein [Paenibacillus abyssi]|uniref:Uncharacterized protein n=1 Tax=Paenibacillus abyssi TaxID=1340531 RepID=A0A917LFP3_9BACL|nr:helix-turn-helix transcriptional regulator [Paenibacillus abyssi]GGG18757.1 hypothetical protein GCM10010916_39430 [Paenibacillus abyssi]